MSNFYFDEENGVAYKVDPIVASVIPGRTESGMIVVQTDVKVTNLKKEKIRRTLMEAYPALEFDMASAKENFVNSRLKSFISGAKRIEEYEYESIKARYEAV